MTSTARQPSLRPGMRTVADLPSPRGLPVLGNSLQLANAAVLHATMERWADEHGPIFRIDLGRRSLVIVDEPEEINAILKARPGGFRRWSRQQEVFSELLPHSTGVFLADGDDWKRQRRLVIAALNTNHLQRYFDAIRTSGLRLHGRLSTAVGDGRPLDLGSELNAYTVDITAALVFGTDLNTLERGASELHAHFDTVMRAAMRRMFAPVPYWRWVRLPGSAALDHATTSIESAVSEFIAAGRERLAQRPELQEQPENLIDGMLAAQQTEGAFSDAEITGNVMNLLFAGEDTTSQTLAWTTWLLSDRPEIQQRLCDEGRAALGDQPFPVDHETTDDLVYAGAVLQESTRLKSVAPALALEALVDTTVCGVDIPAGTELTVLTRRAARSREPDAAEFRPDRWLDEGPTPPKTLAFGGGPRFCPGRNLALVEVKSALAMITRDFEIRRDPGAPPVSEHLTFTMGPSSLPVHLVAR